MDMPLWQAAIVAVGFILFVASVCIVEFSRPSRDEAKSTIRRTDMKPGDRVILKTVSPVSADTAKRLSDMWQEFITSGKPVVVLDHGITAEIVNTAEIDGPLVGRVMHSARFTGTVDAQRDLGGKAIVRINDHWLDAHELVPAKEKAA